MYLAHPHGHKVQCTYPYRSLVEFSKEDMCPLKSNHIIDQALNAL